MNTTAIASRGADIFAEQRRYVFDCVKPLYNEPVAIAEGSGSWVRDHDGREYLDAFAGILTTSVGHCHPAVVGAVQEQAARLGHTSTLYVNGPQVEAAKGLAGIAPGGLCRTFFLNSGTEAIETALQLARLHTGRTEIVALRHAYHGRSSMARAVTGQAPWRGVLPSAATGITHALSPYPYRAPFGTRSDEELVEIYARDLIEVIETTTNGSPAAFIAETIQGAGGYIVPPRGYFQRMSEIIRSYGGLFISDEVQAGFGRTGKWFGIEYWDVVPDIMVLAKGIAGGMPVAATVTRDEIAASWSGKTISTFGGNPVCMAAMVATLGVMQAEDVRARARERGAQLRRGLDGLAAAHRWIGQVRGMGLMQGLELVEDPVGKQPSPRLASALLEAARDEGLLIGLGGLHGQVIRIGPQLLCSEAEVDEMLARLGRSCAVLESAT